MKIKIFLFVFMIILLASGLFAFQMDSSSYSGRNKIDSATNSNSTSASFSQRFISGFQAVSRYLNVLAGRLGILDDIEISKINITYPLNNQDVARGKDVATEDDLGIVSSYVNFLSKVYVNRTGAEIPNINVSFYFNEIYLASNLTNSSGRAVYSYSISSYSAGIYNFSVNYSTSDYDAYYNSTFANVSIVIYEIPRYPGNKGIASQYVDGQTAVFYFNVTKTNSSGTFLYQPKDVNVSAMGSGASQYYPDAAYVSNKRVYNVSTGQFESHVVVNKTFDSAIRWQIRISDDGYANFLASTSHADVAVIDGPICGNALVESPETCDDGNIISGDGCSSVCATEAVTPPGGECFVAGTKITMADGSVKNIEDVKVGDFVKTFNFEKGIVEAKPVLELSSPVHDSMIVLEFEKTKNKNTFDHPYYAKGKGWVSYKPSLTNERYGLKAGLLEVGDIFYRIDGSGILAEEKLLNITEEKGKVQTYNLHNILDNHNFFANGILVHNKGLPTCSDECSPSGSVQTSCVSSTMLQSRSCGNYDSDSCLEWSEWDSLSCETGKVCKNAQCVSPICTENWVCNEWSKCLTGTQTRTCTDSNACGTTANKPIELQTCTICSENWKCDWTECLEGDIYSYPSCEDLNACGTTNNLPQKVLCKDKPATTYFDDNRNLCLMVKWKCNDWKECNADYSINDALNKIKDVKGLHERICVDLSGCAKNKTETAECSVGIPITVKQTEWCSEKYVEIYNEKIKKLVGRIRQEEVTNVKLNKVDISFVLADFTGYCDYCFDGLKNFDEVGVDCGGPGCPECFTLYDFFNWLPIAIIISWLILCILIFVYWKSKERRERKKITENIYDGISNAMKIFKPITRREAEEKERKVSKWFRKLFASIITKRAEEKPEFKPVSVGKQVVKKSPDEWLLENLKSKLALWKRRGYYGTADLEAKIEKLEAKLRSKEKSFVRGIREYKLQQPVPVFPEKPAEKGILTEFFTNFKRAREKRRIIKIRKNLEKVARKKEKYERKRKKKIINEKIRDLKKESRRRKLASLLAKLRLWKKQGYYGTAELKAEINRLKEEKKEFNR